MKKKKNISSFIIGGIGIAIASSLLVVSILTMQGKINLLKESEYCTAIFYNENTVVWTTTQEKGTRLNYDGPEIIKESSDASLYYYEFLGWDINNNGTPDTLPTRLERDIIAKAVFIPHDVTK